MLLITPFVFGEDTISGSILSRLKGFVFAHPVITAVMLLAALIIIIIGVKKPEPQVDYFKLGWSHMVLRQYPTAIRYLTQAIEIDPENTKAYWLRAKACLQLGQSNQAIIDCTKAIELNPRYIAPYRVRGAAYVYLQQYAKAISDLTKVIENDPKDYHAYWLRSHSFHGLKRYSEAKKDTDTHIAGMMRGDMKKKYFIEPLQAMPPKDYTERAVGPLINALESSYQHMSIRESAAKTLGEIGDEKAVPALIEALNIKTLNDEDTLLVRLNAIEALGKIGDKQAVPALIEAMKDRRDGVRKAAAEALGKIGNSGGSIPIS